MLRGAKHGLITARLGWTNSWTHLPAPSVPASLHSSHRLSIHPLVFIRPSHTSEELQSADFSALLCSPLALRRGLKMQSFTSLFIHQISEAQNPIEALVCVLMLWMQTSPLPRPLFPEKLVNAKPRVQPNHFQSCANPYTGLKVILEAAKGTRKSL